MRKFLAIGLLVASAALAQIQLDPSVQKTFTDCASGGSAAQTIAGGTYFVTVTDSDVFLCMADSASTCAANGTKIPSGTAFMISIGNAGQSASCRSAASLGDIQFTRANR